MTPEEKFVSNGLSSNLLPEAVAPEKIGFALLLEAKENLFNPKLSIEAAIMKWRIDKISGFPNVCSVQHDGLPALLVWAPGKSIVNPYFVRTS